MKKIETDKTKFALDNKGKSIAIEFQKPTPYIRKKIADLLKQKPKSQDEKVLETQFKILSAVQKYSDDKLSQQEVIIKALTDKVITAEEVQGLTQSNINDVEINDSYNIQILKAAIDTTKLSEKDAKLVNSSVESDFWQMQDVFMIESAVNYFRIHIRL